MVELLSIGLVIVVEMVKKMLFPKLQYRVILIDLVVVLWICNTHVKGLILLVYPCVTLFSYILKESKELLIEIAEARVYKNMQKLKMKLLEDVLKTLKEDEHHKIS